MAACTSATVVAGVGRRAPCPAVFFGVAGSGQGPEFPAPSSAPQGVTRAAARAYGPAVALVEHDLARTAGSRLAAAKAIDYPAATAQHWFTFHGILPVPTGLDASETAGSRRLVAAIDRSRRHGCGARPVLLAGYSQGAEVVSRAVSALPAAQRRSITVALLGNPSFLPGLLGDRPADAADSGLRPTFLGSGVELPKAVRGRTIDICVSGDPVCAVAHSIFGRLGEVPYVLRHLAVHDNAYARPRIAALAARFLWRHRVPMR